MHLKIFYAYCMCGAVTIFITNLKKTAKSVMTMNMKRSTRAKLCGERGIDRRDRREGE